MKLENKKIIRTYIFTQKDLEVMLGIKGNVHEIILSRAFSPLGKKTSSCDREWEIITQEEEKEKN